MRRRIILILFGCLLNACSTVPAPTWRHQATVLVDELGRQGASKIFPQEFRNLLETFEHGEALLHVQDNHEKADRYYLLALQKSDILKGALKHKKELQQEEERQRAAEQATRAEEERLMREASQAEDRLRDQQRRKAENQVLTSKAVLQARENLLLQSVSYTVRRGETLPQIAARTEIYNDSSLWPIIYRANRDQIRDPKQLWPGQTLKIPRHFSRDQASEARRYSGKK